MPEFYPIHEKLLKAYGPQGWWPLVAHAGSNPTKTGSINGYHVGLYDFPQNEGQRLEICLGAILTQNTSWPQVEKSLLNLKTADRLNIKEIKTLDPEKLKEYIRPSGYHNQKSRYIQNFVYFFEELGGQIPPRETLLAQLGIGPETADSMLLYAFKQPEFVVDTYTKRIFSHLGLCDEKAKYKDIKAIVENDFKSRIKNQNELIIAYQEFHALLVEHAKRHYKKKPYNDELLTEPSQEKRIKNGFDN